MIIGPLTEKPSDTSRRVFHFSSTAALPTGWAVGGLKDHNLSALYILDNIVRKHTTLLESGLKIY